MYDKFHREYTGYRHFDDNYSYDESRWNVLPKILLIVIFVLLVILASGTVLSFIFRKTPLGQMYRHADPAPDQVIAKSVRKGAGVDSYNKIGQVRAITKAEDNEDTGEIVVVSPWFTYPAGDSALFEELSQKERMAKNLVYEYFSTRTRKELLKHGEKNIKDDLLKEINSQLVLGKINGIYFSEYIFFANSR